MKISIKYYVLSIMGFLLFTLNTYFFIPNTVYAAESTPSADIKSKLEELKKEIASKAAKLKLEISNKLKDKAYIGKVKSKSSSSVTIASKNGPKIINLNQDTVFESQVKGKKYSQGSISEEDYIAGLGDVDETGVLTAKKIILLPNPLGETKTFLWGQIVSVSDKLVNLKDKDGKNIAVALPKGESVKVTDYVILTGSLGKDNFDAEFVHIIEMGAKPKKTATPSAQPSKTASPSATPKSTPKPASR